MKEKQFAILGLGRFGEALAITLSELGSNVIVVDKNEEKVQNIANYVTYAVQADVSDINALKSIGLKNVDAVIISITSDINSSIMGVVNAQELGIQEIYGKANNAQHEKVLLKLGVKRSFHQSAIWVNVLVTVFIPAILLMHWSWTQTIQSLRSTPYINGKTRLWSHWICVQNMGLMS